VQQLAAPFSVSQGTISASYLAAGNEQLKPGVHTIRVYGRAEGSFIHLVFLRDLPLLWFEWSPVECLRSGVIPERWPRRGSRCRLRRCIG